MLGTNARSRIFSNSPKYNERAMDYHNILLTLLETRSHDDMTKNIEILQKTWQQLLMKQNDHLYQQIVLELAASPDLGFQYMSTIIHILKKIEEANTNNSSDKDVSSGSELDCIGIALQDIMVIGIRACLPKLLECRWSFLVCFFPFLRKEHNPRIHDVIPTSTKPAPFEVYNRLSFAVESVITFHEHPIFRRATGSAFTCLIVGLFELSYAPLTEPSEKSIEDKEELIRILSMIETWKKNQERFCLLLRSYLNMCSISNAIYILICLYKTYYFDSRKVLIHLDEMAMQPNGVANVLLHSDLMSPAEYIIASFSREDRTTYFQAVCPQLLKLLTRELTRGSMSHKASCCLDRIHRENPKVCIQYVVNVIKAPLQELSQPMPSESQEKFRQRTALQLEESINTLHSVLSSRCFSYYDWLIPYISNIITPLFSLYNNVRRSASIQKSKLKQILVKLFQVTSYTMLDPESWSDSCNIERYLKLKRLTSNETRLFSHLLGFCRLDEYGCFVKSRFGATGRIEIVDINQPAPNSNELVETLMDFIKGIYSLFDILFASQGSGLCS